VGPAGHAEDDEFDLPLTPAFGVFAVARRAYGSLVDIGDLFRQIALATIVMFAVDEVVLRTLGEEPIGSFLVSLSVSLFVTSWVMVGWSRHILLGESAPSLLVPRITRREFVFFVYSAAATLIVLGPIAASIGLLFEGLRAESIDLIFASFGAFAISLVWALYTIGRLMLPYPLIALDRGNAVMTGWTLSRGHTVKLIGLFLVILAPIVVVFAMLIAMSPEFEDSAVQAQRMVLALLYACASMVWGCVAAAASCYALRALAPDA
jgi:hypothetical protein